MDQRVQSHEEWLQALQKEGFSGVAEDFYGEVLSHAHAKEVWERIREEEEEAERLEQDTAEMDAEEAAAQRVSRQADGWEDRALARFADEMFGQLPSSLWSPHSGVEKQGSKRKKKLQLLDVTPTEWTEFAVRIPSEKGVPEPFSFEDRPYLVAPYNIQCYRLLLMCGRQVEKCVPEGTGVWRADGSVVPIEQLAVGEYVSSYNELRNTLEPRRVTWK